MDTKLIAAFACGAALALGACSGGSPAAPAAGGPSDPGTDGPSDPGPDARTPAETFDAAQKAAQEGLAKARRTVTAAVDRANGAVTAEAKKAAQEEIKSARTELEDAVRAARALTAPAGDETRRYSAIGVAAQAGDDLAELTRALDGAADLFAWYGQGLARYRIPNGAVVVPNARTSTVEIERIDRTITVDGTVKANPDAFTSDTFKDVMYADGKKVFSIADDGEGGDEFKVDGWVGWPETDWRLEEFIYAGLKLTDAGLVIRTGGTTAFDRASTIFVGDFIDMRRNLTRYANHGNVDGGRNPRGQNGWDLVLTFGKPHTMSVPVGDSSRNLQSNWTGNGDFYWRSLVPADPSQLEGGDHYAANAFLRPEGFRDLGTYEVWLSNHAGTDTNREPVAGSGRDPHYIDDEPYYLKYAAYGMFLLTADTQTFRNGYNGHASRISTIHFGYSAFADANGQKTTDIGEAIISGKFHGQTLAYEVQGGRTTTINTKLLRGDVTLTVSIPKGTGAGTLEGTMSNFQQWHDDKYWTAYADISSIALNSVDISEDGTFSGRVQATPSAPFSSTGQGLLKGGFYGPRDDISDLEVAGSYTVGASCAPGRPCPNLGSQAKKSVFGSFGAKQRPAAVPASN